MQLLELNLASRPFKNNTLPWVAVAVATVGLAGLTVWNVQTHRRHVAWVEDLERQYAETRAKLEALDLRERKAQREIEKFDLTVLNVRAEKANEVIRWKSFSWTQLFNTMEEVLPNNVQMLSIRPVFRPESADQGRELRNFELAGLVPVSVEGTAKSLEDLFEFEKQLWDHPRFDRVDPERQDTEPNTGSTVFSLRFLYDPRVAPEPPAADAAAEAVAPPDAGDAEPVDTDPVDTEPLAAAAADEEAGQPAAEGVKAGGAAVAAGATTADATSTRPVPPPKAEATSVRRLRRGPAEPPPVATDASAESAAAEDPAAGSESDAAGPGRRSRRRSPKTERDP